MLGLAAFALMMSSFLILVDFAGKDGGTRNPVMIVLAAAFVLSATAFLLIEVYWANSPIISPSLLKHNNVGLYLAVQILLLVAQFTVSQHLGQWLVLKAKQMVSNIATYFARTEDASNSAAALHITPAPVGNAIGALVAGKIISRYVTHTPISRT